MKTLHSAFLCVLTLLSTTYCLEITDPRKCESFQGKTANLCKNELARTGKFEYTIITDVKQCKLLEDSATQSECIGAKADGREYVITRLDGIRVAVKETMDEDANPDRETAKALKTIATQMIIQTTIFATTLVVAIIALVAQ